MGLLSNAPRSLGELGSPKSSPLGGENILMQFVGEQPKPVQEAPKTNFKIDPDLVKSERAKSTIGAFIVGVHHWDDPEYVEYALKRELRKRPQEVMKYIEECAHSGNLLTISTFDKNMLYTLLTRGKICLFMTHSMKIGLPLDAIDAIYQSWMEIHDKVLVHKIGMPIDIHYPWDKDNLLTKQLKTLDEVFIRMGILTF